MKKMLVILYFILFCLNFDVVYSQFNRQDQLRNLYIKNFGAIGDGISDDTKAFEDAAASLQKSGGRLNITKGKYKVGSQVLTGRFGAGYSYKNAAILAFKNVQYPIEIVGENATLIAAAGLKYGSFNPVTGIKDSIRNQGHPTDYGASAYIFIDAINCDAIKISGLEIDGNLQNLDIGYATGPDGIQLAAVGIRMMGNRYVEINKCNIHHCGLDGLLIGWPDLKESMQEYNHIINSTNVTYCGRQAISWVGGNSLKVSDCNFSHTGKGKNAGRLYGTIPGAGIDIEVENNAIIRNGMFKNCIVADNKAPGLYTIAHPLKNVVFVNVKFIGTTNSAIYPKSEGIRFKNCFFVGKVERVFGSDDASKAVRFEKCTFSFEKKDSPTGLVFGEQHEFFETKNVLIKNCIFKLTNRPLPGSAGAQTVYENCRFYQSIDASPSLYFSAIMKGKKNRFFTSSAKIQKLDIKGYYYWNKKKFGKN